MELPSQMLCQHLPHLWETATEPRQATCCPLHLHRLATATEPPPLTSCRPPPPRRLSLLTPVMELLLRRLSSRTTVSLRRQLTKQLLPLATAMGPLETLPQALTTLQPFPQAAPDTTGETGLTNSSRQSRLRSRPCNPGSLSGVISKFSKL